MSKVGEKILSSVRSARSMALLPSSSSRPEVIIFFFTILLNAVNLIELGFQTAFVN